MSDQTVLIYYSSVPGLLQIKKQQMRVFDILQVRKISYQLVDVAADEREKEKMQQLSGKTHLPQLFVNGKYIGGHDELNEINEDGEQAVRQWLFSE